MSEWVLDSSLAVAWVIPDETTEKAERFLAASSGSLFWVPSLWWYEVTNALIVAMRRLRLRDADRIQAIDLLAGLGVRIDGETDSEWANRLTGIATDHGLAAYDAAYLELSIRKSLGMATVDRKLAAAARSSGVQVWS